MCIFFFKQKTAYELRISDWSSDVCSSDLTPADWATFDKDSKGYLTPLEFGNWVMAKQGNDMSAEVEKTKSSKRANIHAVKVLNATGTMFLQADTNGDRRSTTDELRSDERGGGEACVSPCRARWTAEVQKKQNKRQN